MSREYFKDGLTVAELKRAIVDWPEVDDDGEPCQVWVADSRGISNQVCTISRLNVRTSKDSNRIWADILLQHDQPCPF